MDSNPPLDKAKHYCLARINYLLLSMFNSYTTATASSTKLSALVMIASTSSHCGT